MSDLKISFLNKSLLYRKDHGGGKNQDIAKAIGVSSKFKPNVIDATAGLGKDAFILSSLGCFVTMIERNKVVYDNLKEAILNAKQEENIADIIDRMDLIYADSITYLSKLKDVADVIYIDPMFPARKKSALVKQDMRNLQQIAGPDMDSTELLESALKVTKYRVVVKRPKSATNVNNDIQPSFTLDGKSCRFDVYTKKKLPKE